MPVLFFVYAMGKLSIYKFSFNFLGFSLIIITDTIIFSTIG